MLALIENSIDKKNFYVAKKYINEYEFEVNIESFLYKTFYNYYKCISEY